MIKHIYLDGDHIYILSFKFVWIAYPIFKIDSISINV